jgi:molybdopterin synthase catalytic subunit
MRWQSFPPWREGNPARCSITTAIITQDDVDIAGLIAAAKDRSTGAVVTFVGVVRDDGIERIELEAYHDVAVQFMERIEKDATECFGLHAVTIVHRIGPLCVGDNILIIVASAGHRKEAFAGCEYILERIKESVPIWKKEITSQGSRWVKGAGRCRDAG